MHHHHGYQHGAFADPEKVAAKLNSPDRDAWQRPQDIVAALELQAGETVADVGAGTGYMVAHLSRAVGERGTVIALDVEPAMVEYLSRHASKLGPASIRPQQASPDDPQLADASVDAILILDTWHHIDRREDYARKLYLALKPGGRLAIVDYTLDSEVGPPREMRVAPRQVETELETAGFSVRAIEESLPRHYVVLAEKN